MPTALLNVLPKHWHQSSLTFIRLCPVPMTSSSEPANGSIAHAFSHQTEGRAIQPATARVTIPTREPCNASALEHQRRTVEILR